MEIYMNVLNTQRINHNMKAMANLVNRSARDMVGVSATRMGTYSLLKDKAYGKYSDKLYYSC